MPPCDLCRGINIHEMMVAAKNSIAESGPFIFNVKNEFPKNIPAYRHCDSMSEVKRRSQSCELCWLIWQGWVALVEYEYLSDEESSLEKVIYNKTSTDRSSRSSRRDKVAIVDCGTQQQESGWDVLRSREISQSEKLERAAISEAGNRPVYIRILECQENDQFNGWEDDTLKMLATIGRDGNLLWSVELDVYSARPDMLDYHPENSLAYRDEVNKAVQDRPFRNMLKDGIFSSSGSPGCLKVAKSWLRQCLEGHENCVRGQENQFYLPSRLLDVGSAIKRSSLHISDNNEVGTWVALSYCWGGSSDFRLTEKSYERLLSGQSLSGFPPTIRDAIMIVRSLDIRYLWVDALCIFQDSRNDWEIEAPKMAEIYSNAILRSIHIICHALYSSAVAIRLDDTLVVS